MADDGMADAKGGDPRTFSPPLGSTMYKHPILKQHKVAHTPLSSPFVP